ncbi:sigma-54-dependent Fis family transcriptional regulator [Methylocella silvestris]|uniref:Sigma-54-dependent Fis family transcriptional regulator n=1 Tax=Methylocella silvestris TaxID=199596 RepID=A0A2J7TMV4_METSI|nr:sigma-54-dependent Fis family transcriptional regulator [Methylocella silvestris]PNG28047.1 sigma-54-dependent Fis family transcriptional regulator [Methylocella silvestris]
MRQSRVAHIDEVLALMMGQTTERDRVIQESWRRCVTEHGLDPIASRDAYILPQERLNEHRDAMEEFLHTARFGLETLYRQVSCLDYVMLLTDAKGVTVDFMGDPTYSGYLRKAGLYLGSDWHEELAGTCAVGTCIATGEPLIVHQSDHFDASHISLTCTCAPIFDTNGDLAAALDISALHSPEPKLSQHLALQLVRSFTHKIENANLLNRFRGEWILKLSKAQEFLDIDPEYILAVDANGCIIGHNSRTRELLARECRRLGHEKDRFIGEPLSTFFECDVSNLPRFARFRPSDQRTMRLVGGGAMLFAQAMPPPLASLPRQPATPGPNLPLPLREMFSGDPMMFEALRRAAKIVGTQMSILIQGETGTGKEHLAKALHAASPRADKPFVAVNCAALPESLIESELFGYEAGSFTGAASKGKKGLVLGAEGGTLFLDEIGDMPLASQTRLLRVLAEREVTPLGKVKPIPIDIRVIAATHRDLVELVKAKSFREDLYFRLNGAVLTLPPLRSRIDVKWLIERLLQRGSNRDDALRHLSDAALAALCAYSWPGNVRELVNCLDYASAVCSEQQIEVEDLPESILKSLNGAGPAALAANRAGDEGPQPDALNGLEEALREHHWNVSAVARALAVDRSTVHRRMRRLGLVPPQKRDF